LVLLGDICGYFALRGLARPCLALFGVRAPSFSHGGEVGQARPSTGNGVTPSRRAESHFAAFAKSDTSGRFP